MQNVQNKEQIKQIENKYQDSKLKYGLLRQSN